MILLVLLKWQWMWLNLSWNKWTNSSEIINILLPLEYTSSIKTYTKFTMSKRTTRSKATMRDPKEHMKELYEEQSKGELCTSALPCFDSFGEIDLSRPRMIKTGVHSIDSSVPKITSVDEAKVTLHYDERRGRIAQDCTFDGSQWIEFESPFDETLGFLKKSNVQKLGNEVLLGLTGYSFRAFHQDIKPPQSAVCTVSRGRKLWLFRAPVGRDAEWVVRVASSLTLSDVQQLMKDRRKRPRFLPAIQKDGESILQPYGWSHCVLTVPSAPTCWLTILELLVDNEELSHHYSVGVRRGDVAGPRSAKRSSWQLM